MVGCQFVYWKLFFVKNMENNLFKFSEGILTIEEYKFLIQSSFFKDIENFSNNFMKKYKKILYRYGYGDLLHHWSRQYEYCFVYYFLIKYLRRLNINNNKDIKILNTGNGITFLPFYLKKNYPFLQTYCRDIGEKPSYIFSLINDNLKTNIVFNFEDIKKTNYLDNYFGIIFCIAVVEHSNHPEVVLHKLRRILKPGGLLLTFGIYLDNKSDLKIDISKNIINRLNIYFNGFYNYEKRGISNFYDNSLLTTSYFYQNNKNFYHGNLVYNIFYLCSKTLYFLKKSKPLFKHLTVYYTAVTKL